METYIEGLKQRRGVLYSQLHAFEAAATLDGELRQGTKMELDGYQRRILAREKEMAVLIDKSHSELSPKT